ncbi:MAG: hypothetical protein ACI81R_001040 [Bradymonadia bacterium]|jgi:hypothetical protein
MSAYRSIVARVVTSLLTLATSLLLSFSAQATTVAALTDDDLIRLADTVATGTVIEERTAQYDVGPELFTEYVVALDAPLFSLSPVGPTVVIRVPGGVLNDRRVVVPGMPSFEVGEHVLLFLERLPNAFGDAEAGFLPVGLNQGVWRESAPGVWQRGEQESLLLPRGSAPVAEPLTIDALRARMPRIGSEQ